MKDYRYSLRLPEDLAPHSGRLQEAIEHYLSLPKPKPRFHDVSGPYGQHATAWLDEQAYQIAHHAPPGWCRAVLAWHLSSTQASTGLALAPARKDKDGAGLARREMGARARNGKLTRRDLWREYVVVDALRKLILSGQASADCRRSCDRRSSCISADSGCATITARYSAPQPNAGEGLSFDSIRFILEKPLEREGPLHKGIGEGQGQRRSSRSR